MRSWRLTIVAVVALVACPDGHAPGQPASEPATPSGPVLRLGALVPLTGPGAWFGAEIRQGLELAALELDPAPRQPGTTVSRDATQAPSAPVGKGGPKAPARSGEPASQSTLSDPKSDPKKVRERPPTEPVEPADRPRTVTLVVQALDLQPLDIRDAQALASRLLASGVSAILTASPTPTLTVIPLAAARDALVLHAGLPTERFPATSRILLQLRPSAAARGEILAGCAWERGIRRLALLAGGDAFGRAIRSAVAARWRQQGGQLIHDESVSLDAPDLRSRFHGVARGAPEAVVLGFAGTALAEVAQALRSAGYAGEILAADDDRTALLAGGRALEGARVLSDAFVPVPGSRGARFARAYEARHGQPPSRFAASAYEAATLLAEAAARSLGDGRGVSGGRLRDILVAGRRFPSLYAGELVVRDDGTLGRPLALFRVEGEQFVFETYVGVDGRALAAAQETKP